MARWMGAAAACFAAGIAARLSSPVLWCVTLADLFARGLAQAGLSLDRVIHVEAGNEQSVLACMEEGLRHGGLAAAVAEAHRLSITASRRLHLAAWESGTMGIALRLWRRQSDTSDFGQPTAAMMRWQISVLPSAPLSVPGVRRQRWRVELIRAAPARASISNWRAAMRRVVSVWLPMWPTDRLRRAPGNATPDDAPLVVAGRVGNRGGGGAKGGGGRGGRGGGGGITAADDVASRRFWPPADRSGSSPATENNIFRPADGSARAAAIAHIHRQGSFPGVAAPGTKACQHC
ncbi:hypothetical protein SAMN04487971_11098 [Paracoccus chinensis]|uniref:Protein ImuA n=1 Tax=Paracoccus chinensis TaxID=525640 RepID=A0A1G9JYK5_9RHOB|nr:hypothetical protein SAMN04487971_11098 [Paracoccus chinensis]